MLIQLLTEHPEALGEIVARTPRWVWGLLAALTLLGVTQLRTRRLPLRRAVAPAIGLALFSLFSLGKDLAGTPWLAPGLLVWLAAFGSLMLAATRSGPRPGTTYDPLSRRFVVPGSVLPLLTILAIFLLKYAVGVELAMQPSLRLEPGFALLLCAGYGALTGYFAARPFALWQLASRQPASPACA
ncbi:MAG: hypothetical protein JNK17_14860 [Hydrogenophaga sp.]|nr:hypothetical protein [Hydrogenophaga sp.]